MIGAEVTLQLNDRTIYRTYTNEMGRYLIVPTINHGKVDLSTQKDLLGSWQLDLSLALGSEVVLTRFLARLAMSLWTEDKEQTMCHRMRPAR